jgi:hypothetical protein
MVMAVTLQESTIFFELLLARKGKLIKAKLTHNQSFYLSILLQMKLFKYVY